jgi:hypothetical protein
MCAGFKNFYPKGSKPSSSSSSKGAAGKRAGDKAAGACVLCGAVAGTAGVLCVRAAESARRQGSVLAAAWCGHTSDRVRVPLPPRSAGASAGEGSSGGGGDGGSSGGGRGPELNMASLSGNPLMLGLTLLGSYLVYQVGAACVCVCVCVCVSVCVCVCVCVCSVGGGDGVGGSVPRAGASDEEHETRPSARSDQASAPAPRAPRACTTPTFACVCACARACVCVCACACVCVCVRACVRAQSFVAPGPRAQTEVSFQEFKNQLLAKGLVGRLEVVNGNKVRCAACARSVCARAVLSPAAGGCVCARGVWADGRGRGRGCGCGCVGVGVRDTVPTARFAVCLVRAAGCLCAAPRRP